MRSFDVLLVEDQHLLREGLRLVLEADTTLKVSGQAGTAHEALEKLDERPYDVVLMDLSLPDMDGIDCIRALRARGSQVAVLVVTMHEAESIVRAALAAGASGYILKTVSPQELRLAVHQVAMGHSYVQEKLAVLGPAEEVRPAGPSLSQVERELLLLADRGLSDTQIGEQLCVSTPTLNSRLRSLYRKLGVEALTEAVARAIELRLILPNPHGRK